MKELWILGVLSADGHVTICTRGTHARGTRVPATGTGMKRVRYGFEKKKTSTRARRVRTRPTRRSPRIYPARTRGTRRQNTNLTALHSCIDRIHPKEVFNFITFYCSFFL
jgi:hypothetical protein